MTDEPSPEIKIALLERVLINLFHGKKIKYRVFENESNVPNHQYGFLTITDLEDYDHIPKLNDCCDDGLSLEHHVEIVPEEYPDFTKKTVRPSLDVEIWFSQNNTAEIERLENQIKKLEEKNKPVLE